MELTFTKIEAAKRQMRTAIELWFTGGDPISIHALAYASHEIIHRFCKKSGVNGLIFDTTVVPDIELRNKFNLLLKDVPNWIKHAERNEEFTEKKELNPLTSELFLMVSLVGLTRAGHNLSGVDAAFMFWNFLHHRDWFPDEMTIKSIPPQVAEQMRGLDRHTFFLTFLDHWKEQGGSF